MRFRFWEGAPAGIPFAPLSREAMVETVMRYQREHRNADAKRILAGNGPFVRKLIHQILRRPIFASLVGTTLTLDDLIQVGNRGVLDAADRFDPNRGVGFLTYARWWICYRVLDEIKSAGWPIALPGATQARLDAELRYGDEEGAAKRIEKDLNLHAVHQLRRPLERLDAPLGENGRTLGEEFALEEEGAEERLIRHETAHRVALLLEAAMQHLDHREVDVVKRQFLVDDPETLETIGTSLGITRERVRQIEARARRKLHSILVERHTQVFD